MKLIFSIFLLFCFNYSLAVPRGYYVSSSTGSDANPGTLLLPFATISKINSIGATILPGDTIVLKRNDTFIGPLNLGHSGTALLPILVTGYGVGADPIIYGWVTITSGWTNEGGGIYSKVISSVAQTNMVTLDGVAVGVGRFPNTGWLTATSATGNTKVVSTGLGVSTNWTGAAIARRPIDQEVDRGVITAHSNDTLTYSGGGQSQTTGYGFFILNDLRTLDSYGEWYHNTGTGKFYMYFGAVNPNLHTVKVATINNIINGSNFNYIKYDGLDLQGSIADGVTGSSTGNIMQNCKITYCGGKGVYFGPFGSGFTVTNNEVGWCWSRGISCDGDALPSFIDGNYVHDIGMIFGQSLTNNSPIADGIYIVSGTASNNHILRTGYNGMTVKHVCTITNNFIDSPMYMLNDGGGIYTSGPTYIRYIGYNIITNITPNTSGTTKSNSLCAGVYLDEVVANTTVIGNTVGNSPTSEGAGIKLNKTINSIIRDNTTYNCDWGTYWVNNTGNDTTLTGNVWKGNIVFSKTATQLLVKYRNNKFSNVSLFGSIDSNIWARPIAMNNTYDVTMNPVVSWTRATTTATVTQINHGLNTGDAITVTGSSSTAAITNASHTVTVVNANTYTFTCLNGGTASGTYTSSPAGANGLKNFSGTNSWQYITKQETHSSVAPRTIASTSELRFYTNPSDTVLQVQFIDSIFQEPNGTYDTNAVNIPRWGSKVLIFVKANIRPTVSAGGPYTITLPFNSVPVTGTASDPDGIASTLWRFRSGPVTPTFTNSANLSTIVNGLSTEGSYTIDLKATGNGGAYDTASSITTITVNPAIPPVNTPPYFSPNPVPTQNKVLPTNSGTATAIAFDTTGTVSSYRWNFISGPVGIIIANANTATVGFSNLSLGTYSFTVTAIDNTGDSAVTTFQVNVTAAPTTPPIPNAGNDTTITLPATAIILSGSGTDGLNCTISTHTWTLVSSPGGSSPIITTPSSYTSTITNLLIAGTYTFRLTLTSGCSSPVTDDVNITVLPVYVPPTDCNCYRTFNPFIQ